MSKLLLFNKPFGVLSQFTGEDSKTTLAHFIKEKGYYAAGRLDKDSEGLLILTDDGKLQQKISDPKFSKGKTYLAQVEGQVDESALAELREGLVLKDGKTRPALASAIDTPALWPRNPPIRERKHIPTSWLELTLYEGKNRQVRRMTAAVGFPTLRLVRASVGDWKLEELQPGEYKFIEAW